MWTPLSIGVLVLLKPCLFSDRFFNDFGEFLGMERNCDLSRFCRVYVMPVWTFLAFEYPSVFKDFFFHFFWFFRHIWFPSWNKFRIYYTYWYALCQCVLIKCVLNLSFSGEWLPLFFSIKLCYNNCEHVFWNKTMRNSCKKMSLRRAMENINRMILQACPPRPAYVLVID